MRCAYQCHEIGGPYIAENPDCPVHSREAVREEEEREQASYDMLLRVEALERRVLALEGEIRRICMRAGIDPPVGFGPG